MELPWKYRENSCLYAKYCPDTYETKKIYDEAVDVCLAKLKFIPDWFFTSKILETFHDALFANDDILFFDEDFSKVTFFANEMGIIGADLDKNNLDDNKNPFGDHPETIALL